MATGTWTGKKKAPLKEIKDAGAWTFELESTAGQRQLSFPMQGNAVCNIAVITASQRTYVRLTVDAINRIVVFRAIPQGNRVDLSDLIDLDNL